MLKKFKDLTFVRFVFVGVINTLVGSSIMFIAYNLFGLNYWISSILNYTLASILSYYLNKNFTFQYDDKSKSTIFRFIINISACYLIAYGIAQPIVSMLFNSLSKKILDNVAMLFGMVFFIVLNYVGQRYWIFVKDERGK